MKNDRSSPASRLLHLRELLGMSQRELAKEFGVSGGAVALWENSERPVPGPILRLLEMHEQHYLVKNDVVLSGPLREHNRHLSSQWAGSMVKNLKIRSPKSRNELQEKLQHVIHEYLGEGLSSDPVKRRVQVGVANRLVSSLGRVKGIPLKAAQLASYLDFNIPDELRETLSELQSHGEPMPAGQVSRVIFEELGSRPEKLFAEWSPKPFAAASIGQVHKARLKTGEEVVVKVQYNDLQETMENDLKEISFFHHFAILIRGASSEVVQDFSDRIIEECDFIREAENQERFREFFKNDPDIFIPKVYKEYSGKRVLTTEFVEGMSFSEFLEQGPQSEKDRAGQTIVRFYIQSAFKHGQFQGDPNPGNYIFCKDRVAFIDFGRVVHYDNPTRLAERDLLASVINGDPKSGRRFLEELGLIHKDLTIRDFEEFWDFFVTQHKPITVDETFQYSRGLIRDRIRMARGYKKNPMTQVTRPLFWDVFLGMSANALRGDLECKANWHRHMVAILRDAGAKV